MTVDEQAHYKEHVAPGLGNKSLLFKFECVLHDRSLPASS